MRILIQRASYAKLYIKQELHASIGQGLLILVGIEETDNEEDIEWLSKKAAMLRIFADEQGVMNRSVQDIDGEVLVVSQFTLQANASKGNRPSYIKAARPEISKPLYEAFCQKIQQYVNKEIKTGVFGADMQIEFVNDGPVSIWIDSKQKQY